MQRVHDYLSEKFRLYHRWHQHPLHPHVHWGLLGAVVVGVALSFVILGWGEVEVVPVQVARAQSGEVGTDGRTFEQRKAAWLAQNTDVDFTRVNPNPHIGRRYVLAWAEAGTHQQQPRSQNDMAALFDTSSGCWGTPDNDCVGVYIDRAHGVEKFAENPWDPRDQWRYSYNDLRTITGNIPALTSWAIESGSMAAATLARLSIQYNVSDTRLERWMNNLPGDGYFFDASPGYTPPDFGGDMQPLKTAVHYLAAMRSPAAPVTWRGRSTFSQPFTYDGVRYESEGTYNALTFTRAWMYAWMEDRLWHQNYEANSRPYEQVAITAIRLLYDFGEPAMKQRAKMFLDFMFADASAQFSLGVNQWGGVLGRTYRWSYRSGSDWMPWYDYWGASRASVDPEGLISTYRVPSIIWSIPNLSGSNWMLKREAYKGRESFATPSFIVASEKVSSKWRITVRGSSGDGIPFDFWLSDLAGDLDNASCSQPGQVVQGRTVSTCGSSVECYTCLGKRGYQLRNNILLDGLENPVMHFTNASQSFDVVEGRLEPTGQWEYEYWLNNGRWNYLREGNTAIAIHPGPGTGGIEVARIDSSCTAEHCYSSWGAFTSASRSIGSGSFTNGKGKVISASTADSGTSLRFVAESSDSPNLVTWSGNLMTVRKGGRTCTYNFNSWTYSGDCGGGGGTITFSETPPPTSPPGSATPPSSSVSPGQSCIQSGGSGCTAVIDSSTEEKWDPGQLYCETSYPATYPFCVRCINGATYNESTQNCEGGTSTRKGDLNHDGDVDIFDYNLMIENFGNTSCGSIADIDANCKVDIFDYNLLVENFGK